MTNMAIGVIILAAGGSSRMGRPKQLLPYQGQSLVRHAAESALASVGDRVVVVVGSHADEVRNEVADLTLDVIENRQSGASMVASLYGTTKGVPALFSRKYFNELMSLAADEGARRIIASHPDDVATIVFPEGAIDIDSPRDHEQASKTGTFK